MSNVFQIDMSYIYICAFIASEGLTCCVKCSEVGRGGVLSGSSVRVQSLATMAKSHAGSRKA